MESFTIDISIKNQHAKILVIPDDCIDFSIFHLVMDGKEINRIEYVDPGNWTIIDGEVMDKNEFRSVCEQIENHFF